MKLFGHPCRAWAPLFLTAAVWQAAEASGEPAPAEQSDDNAASARLAPEEVRQNVDRLMELIKKRPAAKSKPDRLSIRAIAVDDGQAVLAAQEPFPGLTHCGSPGWSSDGTRIVFDATPGTAWQQTRLMALDISSEGAEFVDLGLGNCPTLSPDGKRIVFHLNAGAVADSPPGLWMMRSDGSDRRHLGASGNAKWSPDGRRLLVASFSSPVQVTLVDPQTFETQAVQLDGHRFYSAPSWADDGETIVAVASWNGGAGIVFVDAAKPAQAHVKRVVWRKGDRLKVDPFYPIYSSVSERCVFAGRSGAGTALYTVDPRKDDPPRRLERGEKFDGKIASLACSPDGRYLLFCSDRDGVRQKNGGQKNDME